ncbi:MAG: helix-turn-helix transcriptional regulator [Comamonas sp.]|jgi:transcriptional regulator with XRE-family HTH domain|uniref:helix-turn-helix domain-containing protein n=1 Tax=Comamonas sp. TaxID=34028 RepID=UPI0028486616|nr:helix-turn-helix transcriptional regulator [Comamonas sp.]MDR3067167.1 helix-turn-helix transcriptional regulator [Comamonas sp.]
MQNLAEKFVLEMRRRRQALSLSQQDLGEKLGIDRNTVSRIERGAPNMAVADATAIAETLGTTLGVMLGATEDRPQVAELSDTFSSKVRELRVAQGLNQRELAELIGVDRNWVSAVESGSQNITLRTLEKFANALKVSPCDLV